MTPATFFGVLIVLFGALAGVLFALSAFGARALWTWRLLCAGAALICLYGAVLWGGLLLGLWTISAELGRPVLALAFAALAWLALAVPTLNGNGKHGRH